MEHHPLAEPFRAYFDRQSLPLQPGKNKILRLFVERGTSEPFTVTITPENDRYVAKGTVDTIRTHDIVLSMVPEFARSRLIDRMVILHRMLN